MVVVVVVAAAAVASAWDRGDSRVEAAAGWRW